jgi:hypothetical protein
MNIATVRPPQGGVWRVGRGPDPLQLRDPLGPEELDRPNVGNRFDSPLGTYRVAYFGRTLEACFGETLARFRPNLELLALIRDEWKEMGFMEPGAIPREWRERRLAVKVKFRTILKFVDLEAAETIEMLRQSLASEFLVLGHNDIDLSTIRGPDRRVTRWISNWVYSQTDDQGNPLYAGIRYLSRLDSKWECWAIFEDVGIEELIRQPIFREDESLQKVASKYRLIVH